MRRFKDQNRVGRTGAALRVAPIALLGAAGFVTLLGAGTAPAAYAQATAGTSFPDVPENHWAYQAVTDLAGKGYVKGFPEGVFLGQRAMTRYEFATVIDRILQTVNDLATKVNTPAPPATPAVTQDDLNKLQVLIDEFKPELATIKVDLDNAKKSIDSLRADLNTLKTRTDKIEKTKPENAYGAGPGRKFTINGYVQARWESVRSGNRSLYPQGTTANLGSASYNGFYAKGGNSQAFFLRRARVRFSGELSEHARYVVHIDTSGFANSTPSASSNSSNAAVSVREAYADYSFSGISHKTADGDIQGLRALVGMFPNPFGYILPLSTADHITVERPLAFNEGANGLWNAQDYDRGGELTYGFNFGKSSAVRATAAFVSGNGTSSLDNNGHVDGDYHLGIQSKDKLCGLGVSYYDGRVARPALGSTTFTGPAYQDAKKQLFGVDARYTTSFGLGLVGEYLSGKYELREFSTVNSETNAVTTLSNQYAPGNKVDGWYGTATYSLFSKSARPLTLVGSYDIFNRSKSGVDSEALDGGGASGSSFKDANWQYGVIYFVDKITRLRVFYTRPDKIAHAADSAEPAKVGLLTTEIQVKF